MMYQDYSRNPYHMFMAYQASKRVLRSDVISVPAEAFHWLSEDLVILATMTELDALRPDDPCSWWLSYPLQNDARPGVVLYLPNQERRVVFLLAGIIADANGRTVNLHFAPAEPLDTVGRMIVVNDHKADPSDDYFHFDEDDYDAEDQE